MPTSLQANAAALMGLVINGSVVATYNPCQVVTGSKPVWRQGDIIICGLKRVSLDGGMVPCVYVTINDQVTVDECMWMHI